MKKILLILFIPFILSAQSEIDTKLFTQGEQIYVKTCISCHGINGETNPKMQLVVKPRKLASTILSQEQSYQVIKEGSHHWGAHSDIMPAFKYVYNKQQLQSIAYYIVKKFNPQGELRVKTLLKEAKELTCSQEKALETGRKIFKKTCALCHGITGNAKSAYVENSKANKQFIYPYNLRKTILSEDQIFLFAKYGSHFWGSNKRDMPSWKKRYSDKKLKSVAKYINQKIKVPQAISLP